MIKLHHVKKTLDDFSVNYDMHIKAGYITGIVGANGAGKTTLMKLIMNFIFPDEGSVSVFEHQPLQTADKEHIGCVFQNSFYDLSMSIKHIIEINKAMYTNFDEVQFHTYCAAHNVNIESGLSLLSNGALAKLKIFLALSHHAKLLILDEPTLGLDVVSRNEILDILRGYMDDTRTIIISSHIASDLENLCDDLYFIDQGTIQMHETMDTIQNQYALIKVTDVLYKTLDTSCIQSIKKESYGYSCLTNQKPFYLENYKDVIIENASIDDLLEFVIKGELL